MKLPGHIGHGPYSSYPDLCPDMSCCYGIMTENVLKNGQMNVRIVKSQEEMAKIHSYSYLAGADPGFVERGSAAATLFEDPLWNFKRGGGAAGGTHPLWPSLKTLFGISKGGGALAPCAPPESASAWLPGLKIFWYKFFR